MRRIWKWLALSLVLVVGIAVAGWYFFLKSDPAPRATIKETPVVTDATAIAGPDGAWEVKPGNSDNFVGYRVTEKLFANISETEATGRTDNVTASMTIDGTTVSDVTVTADLRDLYLRQGPPRRRDPQPGHRVRHVSRGQVRAHVTHRAELGAGRGRDDRGRRPRETSPSTASPGA